MSQGPPGSPLLFPSIPAEYRRRGYRHTVSWAFYGIFFAVVWSLGPFVIRELGGSALQSLLLNLAQGIPLVVAFLWVPFIERRNPARLTGLILAAGGVLTLVSGMGQGLWSFVLVITGGMLISSLARPMLGTALEQIYPRQWRGKLMSMPYAANTIVRMACVAGAGWLLKRDITQYRCVFPAAGLALVVSGVLFRSIGGSRGDRRDRSEEDGSSVAQRVIAPLRATLRNKPLLWFLIGYFLASCGGVTYFNAVPLFANDQLGLTSAQYGLARAGFMFATLVSFYLWGSFMDRFGAALTAVLAWVVQILIFFLFFVIEAPVPIMVLIAVRGLFHSGNMMAFFPLVMHFTEPSETSRGMSLHFTLWGIRWVLTPLLVIFVIDGALFPVRYLFLISAVLAAAGTAVMAAVWWQDHRREQAGALSESS